MKNEQLYYNLATTFKAKLDELSVFTLKQLIELSLELTAFELLPQRVVCHVFVSYTLRNSHIDSYGFYVYNHDTTSGAIDTLYNLLGEFLKED
jgi:hypothetical protein